MSGTPPDWYCWGYVPRVQRPQKRGYLGREVLRMLEEEAAPGPLQTACIFLLNDLLVDDPSSAQQLRQLLLQLHSGKLNREHLRRWVQEHATPLSDEALTEIDQFWPVMSRRLALRERPVPRQGAMYLWHPPTHPPTEDQQSDEDIHR